jgi:hypothetical protein
MLHITNGESVQIRDTGLPGDIVYWNDVLHEGPVPSAVPLRDLSQVRAAFLAAQGWGDAAGIAADFDRRDAALMDYRSHEEVILWFEHDLFDQLQLIQLLDFFSDRSLGSTSLSLVASGDFLGSATPEWLALLFESRRPVTPAQLRLGASAWEAFRSPDPSAIPHLLDRGTAALPYLEAALVRHLEQFPSEVNGLCRTERQILEAIGSGLKHRVMIFLADQKQEERPFMGDLVFWSYLNRLAGCDVPLTAESRGEYTLTEAGSDVLAGRKHHVELNGIDRWLGGVHLLQPPSRQLSRIEPQPLAD